MLRRKATAPDGSRWKLGRRWFPRHRKWKRADLPESIDPGGWSATIVDDLGVVGLILTALLVLVGLVFLILLAFNVVVIAIELLVLLTLFTAGLFGRVVLRKPWTVFAASGPYTVEREVVGWRGSRRLIDELAGDVESGRLQRTLQNR